MSDNSIELMQKGNLDKFLDLFSFYLCKACDTVVKLRYPMTREWIDQDEGARFHHDGALINSLKGAKPFDIFDGIMNAFRVYERSTSAPFNLELDFSAALTAPPGPEENTFAEAKALRYFWKKRRSVFVLHGLESVEADLHAVYQPENRFPPINSMMPIAVSEAGEDFAIDHDILPFNYCSDHGGMNLLFPWSYCVGYIAVDDFRRLGGTVIKSGLRDHFYARASLCAKDWLFVYDLGYRSEAATGRNIFKFSIEDMDQSLVHLRRSGLPCIEKRILQKFFKAASLLEQKMQLLALCE